MGKIHKKGRKSRKELKGMQSSSSGMKVKEAGGDNGNNEKETSSTGDVSNGKYPSSEEGVNNKATGKGHKDKAVEQSSSGSGILTKEKSGKGTKDKEVEKENEYEAKEESSTGEITKGKS